MLRGVNLSAEPGRQTIAIVGPTGAGKTTIINLLPRFYDVTGGAVLIDGLDVRDVTAASLRYRLALSCKIPYSATRPAENIRFGHSRPVMKK
ncbi:MAG: ATP-binding cassette domain-containing protein [Anaerolineae bacterium]